jgi:hypothetical protein
MGLFKCSKCECIENTALGHYWTRSRIDMFIWDETNKGFKGEPLCSECGPKFFDDGKPTEFGKWHNRFPKEHISEISEEERKGVYNL